MLVNTHALDVIKKCTMCNNFAPPSFFFLLLFVNYYPLQPMFFLLFRISLSFAGIPRLFSHDKDDHFHQKHEQAEKDSSHQEIERPLQVIHGNSPVLRVLFDLTQFLFNLAGNKDSKRNRRIGEFSDNRNNDINCRSVTLLANLTARVRRKQQ